MKPNYPTCLDGKYDHHWIIPRAQGSTATGYCDKCQKTYEFFNVIPQISKAGASFMDRDMQKARTKFYMEYNALFVNNEGIEVLRRRV